MKKFIFTILRPAILLVHLVLMASFTPHVLAIESSKYGSNWYQIEVIIFARKTASAAGSEYWRKDLDLHYPQKIVSLLDSASALIGQDDDRPMMLNEIGEKKSQQPSGLQPYTQLEKHQLSLHNIENNIRRSGEFRSLFHKAWLQPISAKISAPAVLIQGGELYGNQYELQGYLKLNLSKYLQIETNLWLAQFEVTPSNQTPIQSQSHSEWPLLPIPPKTINGQEKSKESDAFDPDHLAQTFEQSEREENQPLNTFVIKRIVRMNETRKLRTSELHYLDNPVFGLLIQIKPYQQL